MSSGVIAFTVSGQRQRYLREVLGTWSRARGIGDWHLLFCLEPCDRMFPVAEFTAWVRRSFASTQVRVSHERLGCLRNTYRAMSLAFSAGADFAVLAEEDCEVSTDVLEYFTWARDAYGGRDDMAAICAHSRHAEQGEDRDVVLCDWFSPIIWGTWKDSWENFIAPGWGSAPGNQESWDTDLQARVRRAGRASVFPVKSRSRHIGEISTQHGYDLAAHFYRGSRSSSFTAHHDPVNYQEIPFTKNLGLLV